MAARQGGGREKGLTDPGGRTVEVDVKEMELNNDKRFGGRGGGLERQDMIY